MSGRMRDRKMRNVGPKREIVSFLNLMMLEHSIFLKSTTYHCHIYVDRNCVPNLH